MRSRAVHAAALVVVTACGGGKQATDARSLAAAKLPAHRPHTDHSSFFQKPLADGPAVTKACLECHPDAARQVMATAHWNWEGEEVVVPGHSEPVRIGKKNVINNFCIGVQSNWSACTSCHVGYGWSSADFDFKNPELVDCLVCHDQSGTYQKKQKGAGLPDPSVDLAAAARSVGVPKRQNCGACHFQGGGGNAVKHGDLDSTLLFPSERIDVHMSDADLQCVDCHRTEDHVIPGRSMSVSVDDENRVQCTDCHAEKPHHDARLNEHTARVACQTCHIPYMAVDEGTKMTWDWSQAGQDTKETNQHAYMKIKGRFTWAKGQEPEYRWYNLTSTRYLLGDTIDPSKPTAITAPLGSRDDAKSKIWPFKIHRGKQIYDTVNRYFLVPNVHGDQGYWTKFDWETAAKLGSQATGLAFSGEYDFAPTEMAWPLSHMVTPKDSALQCRDCHGARGRLDWKALGYEADPLYKGDFEHEAVTLADADGTPVVESGKPVSTSATCGQCHDLSDADFEATHGYHARLSDVSLAPERARLMRFGPRLPGESGEDMNCFLCHTSDPDHASRSKALASSEPAWSIAATLATHGLVREDAKGWRYVRSAFGADGSVDLGLAPARDENCGRCHGVVDDGNRPLLVQHGPGSWTTDVTGQVFSPQRIRTSAMNLADKDAQREPWDVHAERLVSCTECHYTKGRPQRLSGKVPEASVAKPGERRRCQSCHSLEGLHGFLPERDQHMASVACEACHVPRVHVSARQLVDGTVVRLDGGPKIVYRGVEGEGRDLAADYVTGYEPVLLKARGGDGGERLTPFNLVSTYGWVAGGEPVPAELVRRAYLEGGTYRAEIVSALDRDHDGTLADAELLLDTPEKVALVAARLASLGAPGATIHGELKPYAIHHGVGHDEWASKECGRCHPASDDSRHRFAVAPYLPGGVEPQPAAGSPALQGAFQRSPDGSYLFTPDRPVAGGSQRGPKE